MSSRRVKVSPLATVAMTRAEPAGLEPLIVALVNAATLDDARGVAARSLSNLACDDAFRRTCTAGASAARGAGEGWRLRAAADGDRRRVCLVPRPRQQSLDSHRGGIAPLVDLVQDYTFAAATLSNLAVDAENQLQLHRQEALRSSSRRYATVMRWRAGCGGCSQQPGARRHKPQ